MLSYPELNKLWALTSLKKDFKEIEDYLIDIWFEDYYRLSCSLSTNVVEINISGFTYLFDISQGRLIATWGISTGKSDERRDKTRMKGHPMGAGKKYHRGHAIPHTLGGETDINLVAQRGSINIGAFRVLENKAVKNPGALYFTYWEYENLNSQIPTGVQQGLLCPEQNADIRWFQN